MPERSRIAVSRPTPRFGRATDRIGGTTMQTWVIGDSLSLEENRVRRRTALSPARADTPPCPLSTAVRAPYTVATKKECRRHGKCRRGHPPRVGRRYRL